MSIDSVKHATGSLLIEIEKSIGSTIGINLTQKWFRNNHPIIVVDNVKPASIADRCGALHCGDQINAIDQKLFDGISLIEANAILRSCTGDFCRIEVTPASALVSFDNRGFNNDHQIFSRQPMSMNPWMMKNNYQNLTRKSINKTRHNSMSKENQFSNRETTFALDLNKGDRSLDKNLNKIMKIYNLRELGKVCEGII